MDDVRHGRLVETFAQIEPIYYAMWDIKAVRVEFKGQLRWLDEFIYLILLDSNREKMYAKVPSEMRSYVEHRMKDNCMYRLNYVAIDSVRDVELKFQKYHFTRGKEMVYIIVFQKRSSIVAIPDQISFPLYPTVPTIKEIAEIKSGKYLTDVFGQICYGRKVEYYKQDYRDRVPKVEIFLLDRT